ncbi:MAG: hypothetical protein ACYC6N_32610 [Pirellulaceae bacterium]
MSRPKPLLLILCVALAIIAAYAAVVNTRGKVPPRTAAANIQHPADLEPVPGDSPPVPDPSPTPEAAPATPESSSSPPPLSDQHYRELVVGTWEDDYQGKRTMTLNEDGTGTMIVELSGMQAALFAARLQFDMLWSLEEGRLKKHTVGGQPEARVNMILKMMGDRVDEPILELTQDRLLLLDKDGETRYDWRRVTNDEG